MALFTISSLLCGLATNLGMLVFFRVLQGVGGGGLQPSEQAILADTFPPAKRGMAFAVYGMAVVAAPALGPTLGGWITDNFTWRWIFFINIPVGILSLILTSRLISDPPYLKKQEARRREDRLYRVRADRAGAGPPAGRARQGPARRLVRDSLHPGIHRHLCHRTDPGGHLGITRQGSGRGPAAVQGPHVSGGQRDAVCRGIRPVFDHDAAPAICAGVDGLHGRSNPAS